MLPDLQTNLTGIIKPNCGPTSTGPRKSSGSHQATIRASWCGWHPMPCYTYLSHGILRVWRFDNRVQYPKIQLLQGAGRECGTRWQTAADYAFAVYSSGWSKDRSCIKLANFTGKIMIIYVFQGYHIFRQIHVALRFALHVSWRLEGVGLIYESSPLYCINTNNGYHAGEFQNLDDAITLQSRFNNEPS